MRSLIFTACILSLGACGKSDAETEGGTDSTSGTGSTTSVATTGGPTSATMTASDTSTEGTDTATSEPVTTSNVTTEPGTSTTDPGTTTTEPGTTTTDPGTSTTEPGTSTTDPGSTGTTTDPGSTRTTGAPVDCAALGPMQCAAEASCKAIIGGKINVAKMCFGKPMFIECVEAGACGDALTAACDPAVVPPEPYQFPDTCIPTDWVQCDAPMVMGPCK